MPDIEAIEAGTLPSVHSLGKSECFLIENVPCYLRSVGPVVCSCNTTVVWGHVLNVPYLAEQ